MPLFSCHSSLLHLFSVTLEIKYKKIPNNSAEPALGTVESIWEIFWRGFVFSEMVYKNINSADINISLHVSVGL